MSPDDKAYAFYLILFLVFIGGSYAFSQRDRMGKAMREGLIWVLIFGGIIIGFGFKDTLISQLFPSSPITDGDSITLRKSNNGHFHALVEVNGQPIDFIVDTGASSLVLSQKDAASVGIDVESLAFTGRAYTANGVTGTASVRLEEVKMGPFRDRNVRASVNEGALFGSLLGMDYLSRFGQITINGDRLTLSR